MVILDNRSYGVHTPNFLEVSAQTHDIVFPNTLIMIGLALPFDFFLFSERFGSLQP